jgi:glycosyltransferase involved in cell wall biosynthesis
VSLHIDNSAAAMKICHVISGYFRNDARVFLRQCLSLKRAGYDVSILTNDGEPDEVLEGIPIFSCRLHWPRWKVLTAAKRQFLPEVPRVGADVYQLHSPELLPLAKPLKRLGKAVVYDAHEDLPRHLLEKEWVPGLMRRPLAFAAEHYLRRTLRQIDDVVTPHSHVVDHLQRTVGKGTLVANFPLVGDLPDVTQTEFAARPATICYTGTVYAYSNQEETLDALALLPDVRYRVAGYIDEAHQRALAARPGASQAEYLGRIGRAELRPLYTSCIAGLAIYDYKLNLGYKLGSYGTNKVFEYMEAGLPLIVTDYTLWKDIVDRYECGVCVAPGSVDGIRAAIEYVVSDRERAFRMGQNGRRAVLEEFNWASEEKKYLGVFERLGGVSRRSAAPAVARRSA